MKKRKQCSLIWGAVFCMILLITGCCSTPDPTSCAHESLILHDAVSADFFRDGNNAYYQCSGCGAHLNEEKQAVSITIIPKLSPEVSVYINGNATPLILAEHQADQITWSLDNLKVSLDDVITVQDASENALACTISGDGTADEAGAIVRPVSRVNLRLTATPSGLELQVTDSEYQGIVVQVNDEQYPMHYVCAPDADLYIYGYLELKPGDRLAVIDNVTDIPYGHDALSQDLTWNLYDYHSGENGEFIIDAEGRYLVEFDRDCDKKIRISKVFAPSREEGYAVNFRDSGLEAVPMKETRLSQDSGLSEKYTWFVTGEIASNSEDIAAYLAENAFFCYSALVYLEEGTQFCIESTAGSNRITGDHMTQLYGPSDCVTLSGEYVRISQSGTYLIKYMPFRNSFSLEQLSTQGVYEAAKQFDKQICAVPSKLEFYYAEKIKSLYEKSLYLSEAMRPYLKTLPKLNTLYRNVMTAENTTEPVVYHINAPDSLQVYRSKEDLCKAFYTDFYYFISAYHGTAHLETYSIFTVEDFIDLATGIRDAGYTKLYGIGYIAGLYFLESNSNGILETQPETTFLGFCHKNGLYQELVPFLIRYFAYWRIDEHYALLSNSGADFFVEAWAPTVDIAKFFYYNENTSYVQTDRVLDCFNNIAGVVYGLDSATPLPTLKLRGYIFEGWYDNPDFRGDPVTQADSLQAGTNLYAKWRPDTAQQDRDQAALVDVYIYNLTTQRARKNAKTVGYVKAMYDSLSENAKQLVEEYHILKNLIAQYCG